MTDVGSPYDQEEHYRRPKGSFTLCLRCALRARVCAVIELTENNDAFTLYDTIRYDTIHYILNRMASYVNTCAQKLT